MAWLRQSRVPSPRPVIRNPLAVVPLKPDNVELRRDSRGQIHLRLHTTVMGLRKRVADALRYDYSRKIALDEMGTRFYGLVDGVRTLGGIVDEMANATGKDRKEVADSVVLFTKNLMTRNLIVLKVPGENGNANP